MTHRLYSILVLSVFVSFFGNAQNNEPALDKIQDATTDVKRYDVINYQHIADQKYFKNNPEALTERSTISLEEQVSHKSSEHAADHKGINANHTPHDQTSRNTTDSEIPFDRKLERSAEELLDGQFEHEKAKAKSVSHQENTKLEVFQPVEKKSNSNSNGNKEKLSNSSRSTTKTSNKSAKNEVTSKSLKSEESKIVATTKKEEPKVKHVVDSAKLKAVKELVNAPFIQYKDNHKVTSNQKSTQLAKVVDKSSKQVEAVTTNMQSSSEESVVDQLINSGIYDVYDDGKYIKFSKKRTK